MKEREKKKINTNCGLDSIFCTAQLAKNYNNKNSWVTKPIESITKEGPI